MSSVSSEQGSAVSDFILVAFPMLFIFVATVSISLTSYVRTVLLDATIEGARYAALADQSVESGISRAQQLVAGAIGSALVIEIVGAKEQLGDLTAISMSASALLPLGTELVKVKSIAVAEEQD